jgi:hypothetical protein
MSAPAVARSPAVSGAGGPRVAVPKFPVWSPDGHMEMHTREVINDLVRHGTWCDTGEKDEDGKAIRVQLTWTLTDPALSAFKRAQRDAVLRNGQAKAESGVSPQSQADQAPADSTTMPKLTALRKEFEHLGGAPDPTWGISRLTAAIAAKKAGQPLPTDSDAD